MAKRFFRAAALLILLCLLVLSETAAESALPAGAKEGAVLPVIMYHQLSEDYRSWNGYVLDPQKFRADLRNLAGLGYTPVSVKELTDYAGGGELPEKPVLLTFDDGDESFYTIVYPIIQEFDVPVLLSPVGEWVEQASEKDADQNGYVTFGQVREMLESGLVEIGNHTYALHNSRTRRGVEKRYGESSWEYREALVSDIVKAQRLWQVNLGLDPTAFTYPFGFYSGESEEVIRPLGFAVTLTCREKVNRISGPESLYLLGRYNRPNGISSADFLAEIDRLVKQTAGE